MRLRQASSSRFREVRPAIAWISPASSPPAARSSRPSASARSRSASRTGAPRRLRSSPSASSTFAGRRRRSQREVDARDAGPRRAEPRLDRRRRVEGTLRALPAVAGAPSTARSRTRSSSRSRPSARSRSSAAATSAWLATGAGKVIREIPVGTERGYAAALATPWARRSVSAARSRRRSCPRRARSPRRTRPVSAARVKGVRTTGDGADARAAPAAPRSGSAATPTSG